MFTVKAEKHFFNPLDSYWPYLDLSSSSSTSGFSIFHSDIHKIMTDLWSLRSVGELTASQLLPYAAGFLLVWPVITISLRFQRLNKTQKHYDYPTRESMAKMTDEEAFSIQKQIAQLEFPFMFIKSLQFALFRVNRPNTKYRMQITSN